VRKLRFGDSTAHHTAAIPLVRARLACEDLPEESPQPTLVLATGARRRLQEECLFHELRRTSLRDSPKLMMLTAARVIEDGLVEAILSDLPFGTLLRDYAEIVWSTAMIPGSAYHWAWHDFQRIPDTSGLTRSLSSDSVDVLGEQTCTCAPRVADLALLRSEVREQRREFEHSRYRFHDDDDYVEGEEEFDVGAFHDFRFGDDE
jgi:hypothetical protein